MGGHSRFLGAQQREPRRAANGLDGPRKGQALGQSAVVAHDKGTP